jgi:hypothetical protein
MEVPQLAISKANTDHHAWGRGCDGWYLVKNDQMAIIHERMPRARWKPYTSTPKRASSSLYSLEWLSWNTAAL